MTDDASNPSAEVHATGERATAINAGAGSNVIVTNSVGISIRGQTGDISIGDVVQGDKIIQHITPPPALAALHQLRAPVADFVGREVEINELVSALGGGVAAVLTGAPATSAATGVGGLTGMGGIGKTELAMVVAQRLTERYPDAQIVLNLQGSRDLALSSEEALRLVVGAFHPDTKLPDDPTQLPAHYRNVLTGKRVLILADDAADAAQVRPLLPPPGSALLVTSRRQFVLPGMYRLDLGRLPVDEAVTLLQTICSRLNEVEAGQLAAACGLLPLALRVAAGALAADTSMSIRRYLSRLADKHRRLAALRDQSAPDLDVETSLALSYDLLSAEAQRDLLTLGVFAASFDLAAGAAVLDVKPSESAELRLGALCHRSLLEYVAAEQRYDLHELVRSFALARLGDEEREARLRHARHYIAVANAAKWLFFFDKRCANMCWALLDQGKVNLDAARHWLCAHSDDEACALLLLCELSNAIPTDDLLYDQRGGHVSLLEAALAAVRQFGKRDAEGWFLEHLGNAYYFLGDYPRAIKYHQQRLAIARDIGDRQGEAMGSWNLGLAFVKQGELARALPHLEAALAFCQTIGHLRAKDDARYVEQVRRDLQRQNQGRGWWRRLFKR